MVWKFPAALQYAISCHAVMTAAVEPVAAEREMSVMTAPVVPRSVIRSIVVETMAAEAPVGVQMMPFVSKKSVRYSKPSVSLRLKFCVVADKHVIPKTVSDVQMAKCVKQAAASPS